MEKEEFTFVNDRHIDQTISVEKDDFTFVQKDSKISDQKFQTKPTTFFKDALRRFTKNKSSVVAAVILGLIIMLSLVLPVALPSDVYHSHPTETKLTPKLFSAGTGWWDGTKKYSNVVYDEDNEKPYGSQFRSSAVLKLTTTAEGANFVDTVHSCAKGGYMRLWNSQIDSVDDSTSDSQLSSYTYNYNLSSADYKVKVVVGDIPSDSFSAQGEYSILFKYTGYDALYNQVQREVVLKDYSSNTGTIDNLDINSAITRAGYTDTRALNGSVVISLKQSSSYIPSVLVSDVIISSDLSTEADELASISCTDANAALSITSTDSSGKANKYYWTITNGQLNLYHASIRYCTFYYDLYEDAYGEKSYSIGQSLINSYISKGWMELDLDTYVNSSKSASDLATLKSTFKILDDVHCPLRSVDSVKVTQIPGIDPTIEVTGSVSMYRYDGYTSMPVYFMGTDAKGRDLLNITFTGLRTSLVLGVLTSAVCFLFGLLWGSISGYFGGWTDIAMERFTDILSGMPWIVVMTLVITLMGSNFLSFAIALCLTGWIGTAAITRTQFYRFKRREYILAARTLGASDFRLIFRHILPNAVGTIITSSVLMIPSVIFEEATISYLGLGLQDGISLGIILSENQTYIDKLPYLIVFPSVVMALIMISFNLFGNGLRDAFNPSLKGQD